jgi:Hint domain
MKTGFRGTFVISWSQTKIDGQKTAPLDSLTVGAAWSWHGETVQVDGPSEILRLDQADGEANLRKRAARSVRRLVGAAVQNKTDLTSVDIDDPIMDSNFVVTDGVQSYTVTLIEVGPSAPPLLMFLDELPPRNVGLWIVHQSLHSRIRRAQDPESGGVICFTPGTRIATPEGPVLVEDLREGDQVQTRDNGAQDIMWIGSRKMTGARLFVMPRLRPVRFRAGALGIERPDQELLVSPQHRMLIRGQTARALFNTPEVLVAASELVNGTNITVDLKVREVEYIHLLLPSHQIIWANGVETESFHPASAALTSLDNADRARLLAQFPELKSDRQNYGDYARRNLSTSESAILRHEAA